MRMAGHGIGRRHSGAACDDDVPFAVPFDDVSLDLPLGSFHLPFDDDFAFDYLHAYT